MRISCNQKKSLVPGEAVLFSGPLNKVVGLVFNIIGPYLSYKLELCMRLSLTMAFLS